MLAKELEGNTDNTRDKLYNRGWCSQVSLEGLLAFTLNVTSKSENETF